MNDFEQSNDEEKITLDLKLLLEESPLHHQKSQQCYTYLYEDPKDSFSIQKHDKKVNQSETTSCKADKTQKINSSKNSHKTYHCILKMWLEENECKSMVNKYNSFYNKRVYFVLVLDQIFKQIDGSIFVQSYQSLARTKIERKQQEIKKLRKQKGECEQVNHLTRVIQDIQYSIQACIAFIQGRVYDALIIVYKRNQQKISKLKQFQEAVKIFKNVTGYQPYNL